MAARKTTKAAVDAEEAAQAVEKEEAGQDTTKEPEAVRSGQDAPERDLFAGITNPCVYCGPSVRGVARQYTTYQGGIPEPLREFIKKHPAARGLICSTGTFASVRKRLDIPGTAEYVLYKRVKSEI